MILQRIVYLCAHGAPAVPRARFGDRGPKFLAFIEYHKDCPNSRVLLHIWSYLTEICNNRIEI